MGLLACSWAIVITPHKNTAESPEPFTDVLAKDKNAEKEEKKQLLAYKSLVVVIFHSCLCFLWQDNNSVFAMTTAHRRSCCDMRLDAP